MKITVFLVTCFIALTTSSLLEMSQTLWAHLLKGGFQRIGKLDPLRIPLIKVDQAENNTNYRIILRNVEIAGLNDSMLESVHIARGKMKSNFTDSELDNENYSDFVELESIRQRFHTLLKEQLSMADRFGKGPARVGELVEVEYPFTKNEGDEKKAEIRKEELEMEGVTLDQGQHYARIRIPLTMQQNFRKKPADVEVGISDHQRTKDSSIACNKTQDEASKNIQSHKGTDRFKKPDSFPEHVSLVGSSGRFEKTEQSARFEDRPTYAGYEFTSGSGKIEVRPAPFMYARPNAESARLQVSEDLRRFEESREKVEYRRPDGLTKTEGSTESRHYQGLRMKGMETHPSPTEYPRYNKDEPIGMTRPTEMRRKFISDSHTEHPLTGHFVPVRFGNHRSPEAYSDEENPTQQYRNQPSSAEGRLTDFQKIFGSLPAMKKLEKQPGFVDIVYIKNEDKENMKPFENLRTNPKDDAEVYGLSDLMKDIRTKERYIVHNFTQGESLYKRNDGVRIAMETKRLKDMIRYAQDYQEKQGYFAEGMELVYHYGGMGKSDDSKSNQFGRIKRQQSSIEKEDTMHVILQVRFPLLAIKADYVVVGKVEEELLRGSGVFIGNFTDLVGEFTIELKKIDENKMIVRATRAKLVTKGKNIQLQRRDEFGPVKDILMKGGMATEAVVAMIVNDLSNKVLNEKTADEMAFKLYSNLSADVNSTTESSSRRESKFF